MPCKGVILDVDGTLVLSNDAHARAWVDAFAEQGYDVPFERVRPLIGMGGDKLIPAVAPGLSEDTEPGKTIAERRKEIFSQRYVSSLEPAPGARELVRRLVDEGLKVVVASSARSEELAALLQAANVGDLIEDATTASDADESKPAPDIVGAALETLGLPADDVVMLGDTPYDIESAQGCGVGVIAVRCGGWRDHDLRDAIAIYDDPADLMAHYAESPLGR